MTAKLIFGLVPLFDHVKMNERMNEWMMFTPAVQTLSKPLLIEDGSRAGAETRPCKITQSESMSALYLTIRVMLRICYADICMYCVAVIDFLNIAPWTNNPPICSLHRTKLIIVANSTALLTLLLINRGCPQIVKQTLCWLHPQRKLLPLPGKIQKSLLISGHWLKISGN